MFTILGLLGFWGNAEMSGVLWRVVPELMVRVADHDVLPDSEEAMQVYSPPSAIIRSFTIRVPLLDIVIRVPRGTKSPSLCQWTRGVGVPTARQGK